MTEFLRQHGLEAFRWKIEEQFHSQNRTEALEWAREHKYSLIELNGGEYKGINSTRKQTLYMLQGHSVWRLALAKLKLHKDEFGHCDVPANYVSASGFKLGLAVGKFRQEYRSGTLPESRLKTLNNMGFVCDLRQTKWEEVLKRLSEFKDKEGHLKVPTE
eukprot:scaffold1007_cov176-Amphora_coffeaeformis.AAC.19